MGCINRNSREFKYLMDRYNLSDTKLEHIVHKYWIEVGSEEDFPSDVYIKAQLGNTQYMESSESVRKVWDTLYSKPAKYNTREQLDNALREAAKYFPEDAITYYKDRFDNYVLVVKKPVAKTENSIDNFLELLNIPERAGVKRILRRGLSSNNWNFREMSAEEIRNSISEYINNEVKDANKAQRLQEQLAGIKDDDLYEDLLVAEQEWDDYQMLQRQSNTDEEIQFAVEQNPATSDNNFQQVGELKRVNLGLDLEESSTDIEPQEFYSRESVNDYVQNLVNLEHINRKYINVVHVPATDTTDDYWRVTVNIPKEQPANQGQNLNPATMSSNELWNHVASFAEPMGERPVTYIPIGKEKQQYIVKDGHIYNKEGKEVFTNDSKDRNKILANLAILEDRAVVVTYRDKSYVVDNNRQITSVTTGDIMKWGNENGDRKAILNEAVKKFRVHLQERQQRNTEMMPQLPAHMTMQGITVHDRTDMAEFLKTHDITNLQQAAEEQREMQEIKAKAIADGTFMKAPNGKPTNLDERQWLQVRTKNFINWFGDWINDPANASKVVDENGEPLVVYHGSPSEFTQFDKNLLGTNTNANSAKLGFFFSKTYEASRNYVGDVGFGEDSLGIYVSIPEIEQLENEYYSELNILDNEYEYEYITKEEYETSATKLKKTYDTAKEEVFKKVRANNNKVKQFFLNIRKPSSFTGTNAQNITGNIQTAIANHSDGAILKEVRDPSTTDDYVTFNPNQIKSATDNIGTFSTESDDIQMNVEPWTPEDDVTPTLYAERKIVGELTNVVTNEFNKAFGDNFSRTFIEISHQFHKMIMPRYQLLYNILLSNDYIESITKDFIEQYPAPKDFKNDAKWNKLLDFFIINKRYEVLKNARNKGLFEKNVLNDAIQEAGRQVIDDILSVPVVAPSSANDKFDDDLPFFKTPQGEVYGFVTKDGKIYLDETIISPNHAIHEYTHLWDRAVQSRNPKLWNRGVELMKQLDLWKEVENSDQYGKVWKAKNITGDRLINLIASEVHARLVGPQGEALLNRIAKEKGSQGIVGKLKQWILDFWKDIKATFSNWSDDEINRLTLDDFNKMTVRDFADAIKLNEQPQQQPTPSNPTLEQFKKDIDLLAGYYEGGGRVLSDDLPSITKELDDKLEDYFMGGKELSILDYRELWKLVEFYDESGERRFREKSKPTKERITNATQKHQGNWTRQEVENNPRTLYVFTDNTDRDSGSGVIPADSWYSKKYGEGHHFPTMTAAVVRGLDNSRPISTQRWYHNGAKGVNGRWTDADVEEFKRVIREELEEIVKEFNTGKYDNIMFPDGDGLFNTSISNITKARTPKLYQALADLLHEYGFDKLIPSDVTAQTTQQQKTVADIYNVLKQQYVSDSSESKLLDLVYNALKDSDIRVEEADLGDDISGRFVASENKVLYNPKAIQGNTLLHELIHAATSYYLRAENTEDFPQEVKIAIEEINECYNLLKQDFIDGWKKNGVDVTDANFNFWIEGNDTYGYTSPEEMVAELGKAEFVNRIKDFDKRHKGKNIFQGLIDSIARLFGINKTYGNLESTLKKALTTLLTSPSKELMSRYAQENAKVKENHKKLNESVHVVVENRRAINELLKTLPESNGDYVDAVLKVEEELVPDSFGITNGVKISRMRDLRSGTIMIYAKQLFMTLNGAPSVSNGTGIIPVRIYSKRALSSNNFNIRRDANGVDYVESTTPIFNIRKQQPIIQNTQQPALPGPETKINIYAGTNENADLSNFAERPVDVSKGEVSEVLHRYLGKAFKAKFKTVEGAFQAMKIFFSSEDYTDLYIPQGGLPTIGITKKGDQMLTKFENASGSQARSLGRQIQGFDKDKWDKVSSIIMKALIKASFEQNPQALQRLLATGNATLTHTQDKGRWGTEFPRLLMEVRDELRGTQPQSQPTVEQPAFTSLDITPINNNQQIKAKASMSNKFIGFAEGIPGSHTAEYARQAGNNANTGNYTTDDVVFVSIENTRGKAETRQQQQDRTIEEAVKAINDGATLVTDGLMATAREENEGDRRLAKALQGTGAVYEERTVDSQVIGTWRKSQQESVPQQQSFTAVLPNYNRLYNVTEDTVVDAQWKIQYLEELDAQLKDDNTEEQNDEISDQMSDVLDALSEKDYLISIGSKENKQMKQILKEYDKLNQQIDNLRSGSKKFGNRVIKLGATETRELAEQVMNSISDELTRLQDVDGALKEDFPEINTTENPSTVSRRELVEIIGINNLLAWAKKQIGPESGRYHNLEMRAKAGLAIENFDALVVLGADIFVMNEGFGIQKDYSSESSFKTSEAEVEIDPEDMDSYKDADTINEIEGDAQEHWQVEARTVDTFNSMSQLMRMAIHQCYLLDNDGNKILDKWGIPQRVNPKDAVQSILKWMQNAYDIYEMTDILKQKSETKPWVKQLLDRLQDTSGNEADFQSQFFSTFRKSFQTYAIVRKENGKFKAVVVNDHPARKAAMENIQSKFNIGMHPLFSKSGINQSYFEVLQKANNELKPMLALLNRRMKGDTRVAFSEEDRNKAIANLSAVARTLGHDITEEDLSPMLNERNIRDMIVQLGYIIDALNNDMKDFRADPKKGFNPFSSENGFSGNLRKFITPITDSLEETYPNTVFENGKMYQSFVTPSFLSTLMAKLSEARNANTPEAQRKFMDWIEESYGYSKWFKRGDGTFAWRNPWIRKLIQTIGNGKDVMHHKVELNFNKHNYMRNMTQGEYAISIIANYFSEKYKPEDTEVLAWFKVPMMSNKPSCEYIKFYSYRGNGYKSKIVDGLFDVFLQEADRIQTVNSRNLSKGEKGFIKNFSDKGKKFHFLPNFNRFLNDTATGRLAELLRKKVKGEKVLTADEIVELTDLVKAEIKNYMDMRTAEILAVWERQGIIDAAKDVDKIAPTGTEEELRQNLENFIWNDFFASTNILQITITDLAFYKDSDDLQKRLAELHAPGMRANKYATDYRGEKVSDGYYRTAILKDFDSFISNVIANITEVFDRKIERAPESEKAALRALKDDLVRPPKTRSKDDEGGKYWNINVADAQGLTSPTAYRKKALMFGKWSQAAEDVYNRVIKGEANLADIKTAFQPLKPFVYGHMRKNVGNDVSPIQDMPIPFQAKNSEYLLIMADAIIQGEKAPLSRPNLLRAIYHAMEDSGELMKAAEGKDKKNNATKGIDTIQFESAIKSGLQTPINVHQYLDNESLGISASEAEQRAYYEILNNIFKEEYKEGENGERERVYREYDTDNVVAVTSYDNFCLQQEVPEHFQEHQQVHGSQERMIIPSDLTPLIDPTGNPADESNINWYTYGDIKMRAGDLRKDYEKTISDNIEQSISELARRLKIDSSNRKMRNIALSRLLQEEIVNSPRYGIDMFQACSLNKDGEFRIPKGDPIQAKRIEQLINSIIKNSVNKQEIAGGPIVQVANFGTSRDLHIRFNARSGGILLLEKEWDAQPEHEAHKKYKTYDEYKKAEQAGIAYYEVFIPVWDEELFAKFRKQDGSIDIEAIEATDPELLMMVSYRIPTEEKYSCAPQKAVGFMPKEAGSAIMLPQELTEIDDSDFDVDKRYVMRKEYDIKTRRTGEIRKMLTEAAINSYANAHNGMTREEEKWLKEQISMFLDNPDVLGHTDDKLMQWLHSIYRKVAYYTEQNDVRKQRNNHIIDLSLAVLQNEFTAELILNPGGFDNVKKAAYMVAAYKAEQGKTAWEDLEKLDIDKLKEKVKTDRLLTWVDSQLYYYKQNAAAASLVGVFAVNKTAHATLEGDNILMGVKDLYQGKGRARNFVPFKVLGKTFNEKIPVDNTFGENGLLIGKTLGSLIPSATDAAKEPCLDHINVSMTTAGMLTSLVRFGMPLEDAALFMGQDIILSILEEFDKGKLTKFKSLDDIITARIKKLQDKLKIDDRSPLNNEELTREQALLGLLPSDAIGEKDRNEYNKIQYKTLVNFRKLKNLASGMRNLTFSTRFNSIASAVGPLIIDNLILEYKMEKFTDNGMGTGFYSADGQPIDINWVFERHPILHSFSKAVGIAAFMFRDMPAGSQEFRNVLDALPEKLRDKILTDKKLLSALSDFFQSYLAVASGLVDPNELKYYIEEFPREFIKEYKAKHPNNKLVQDIKSRTIESSGRLILQLPITGLSEQEREVYRNAWTDLHNEDPELSHKLFNYCFFRAGIGFSPKTFMSLVPLFVKENLATELESGEKVYYVDTYRHFPKISSGALDVIVDQFVRNNWNNSSLVPQKGGKGTYYQVDLENGVLNAASESDLAALSGIKYFKTEIDKKMYLWKLHGTEEENQTVRTYDLITPLGNNGEYFEISADAIKEAMTKTEELRMDEENPIDDSNMDDFETSQEQESDEHLPSDKVTEIEVEDFIDGMVDYWKSKNINQDREQAVKQHKEMKAHPEQWGKFIQNVYEQLGVKTNMEEAIEMYKDLC